MPSYHSDSICQEAHLINVLEQKILEARKHPGGNTFRFFNRNNSTHQKEEGINMKELEENLRGELAKPIAARDMKTTPTAEQKNNGIFDSLAVANCFLFCSLYTGQVKKL